MTMKRLPDPTGIPSADAVPIVNLIEAMADGVAEKSAAAAAIRRMTTWLPDTPTTKEEWITRIHDLRLIAYLADKAWERSLARAQAAGLVSYRELETAEGINRSTVQDRVKAGRAQAEVRGGLTYRAGTRRAEPA
jgi:hypothetical protein